MLSESLLPSEVLEASILEFEDLEEVDEAEELEEEELEEEVPEEDEVEWAEFSESSLSLSSPSSKSAKWVLISSSIASKIPWMRACHSDGEGIVRSRCNTKNASCNRYKYDVSCLNLVSGHTWAIQ